MAELFAKYIAECLNGKPPKPRNEIPPFVHPMPLDLIPITVDPIPLDPIFNKPIPKSAPEPIYLPPGPLMMPAPGWDQNQCPPSADELLPNPYVIGAGVVGVVLVVVDGPLPVGDAVAASLIVSAVENEED